MSLIKHGALFLVFSVLVALIFFRLEANQASLLDRSHPQTAVQLSSGEAKLPILYYSGHLVGAFYLVDPKVAATMVPDSVEPLVLPIVNKAIAGVFLFEYKNTTIGPYHEMGLTIQTRKKGSSAGLLSYTWDLLANMYHLSSMLGVHESLDTGLNVVTLPVSTQAANDAGREIWGYPKYVASMTSTWGESSMDFSLADEFSFKMTESYFTAEFAGLPFLTYTELNGDLLRTIVHVGHKARWGYSAAALTVTEGATGATAVKVKALKLDEIAPAAVFRTDKINAHLPAGLVLKKK